MVANQEEMKVCQEAMKASLVEAGLPISDQGLSKDECQDGCQSRSDQGLFEKRDANQEVISHSIKDKGDSRVL